MHEIALVAELAQQQYASVWKRPLLAALVRPHSFQALYYAQPLISDA
jgi:hypothetical protein